MTTTSPKASSNPQKGRTIAKGVVLWLIGVIIITAIFVGLLWNAFFKPTNANSVTVGDVVSGKESAAEQQEQGDGTSSTRYPGYRLVELAAALGLPDGVMPEGAIEMGMDRDEARAYLIELVNQAVAQGKLTPVEADGVIKAYNEGIVSAPVNLTDDGKEASDEASEASETSGGLGSSN
ncbi:hypothetical protein ACG98H_12620 [Corynebacterium sp. L4756]|uniref:hypothetical protein n=1 Tax=unclassified Corynebacterium TaxID=2624378 RepID=UPI00374D46F4